MSNQIESDAANSDLVSSKIKIVMATLKPADCSTCAEPDGDEDPSPENSHGYRAVVIGLALQLGKEDGADSVPNCIMHWLWQAVLEGCPSSKVALDWLYRRQRSAHNDASAFPKALEQSDPSTSTGLSEGVIHLAAFMRGGHYD